MFRNRTPFVNSRIIPPMTVLALMLAVIVLFSRIEPVQAAGALSFTVDATPTTVDTGEIVEYLLNFS